MEDRLTFKKALETNQLGSFIRQEDDRLEQGVSDETRNHVSEEGFLSSVKRFLKGRQSKDRT